LKTLGAEQHWSQSARARQSF